jgi:RNA polymerase sigma-70 factor (ECF subfamily)
MAAPNDSVLVTQARDGDKGAFGELVARHTRAMFAIARAYFASEADAEDAVQDAFVRAYQSLGQLRSPGRFAAWLARITVNTSLDILRLRSDKVSLADFATSVPLLPRLGQPQLTPATLASKGERGEMLRAAVGRLPENQRLVIMLRYAGEMSYQAMASYLDVPVTTVESRLHRAKQALRKMLGPLDTPDG